MSMHYKNEREFARALGIDTSLSDTDWSARRRHPCQPTPMAALEAAQSVCSLPVMCSLTLETDGNLLWGGTVTDAVEALQEMGAAAVGLNCSVGPDQLESVISSIKAVAKVPVIAKPNAGMPVIDEHGVAHYDMPPGPFARAMRKLVWRGAGIVGGCCGTDPEYIRLLAAELA